MFPKVPQSSLGILRLPQLPPPLEHPPPLRILEVWQGVKEFFGCVDPLSSKPEAILRDPIPETENGHGLLRSWFGHPRPPRTNMESQNMMGWKSYPVTPFKPWRILCIYLRFLGVFSSSDKVIAFVLGCPWYLVTGWFHPYISGL